MNGERRSLKRRMLWMLALSFIPMLAGITLLFAETLASEQRAEIESLHYTAVEINETLEKYASGIYSASDAFSSDERLVSVIDKDYTDDLLEKRRVIVFILNTLFESYNRILQQEKMAAVYVVPKHELFDFIDPNQDAALVVQQLDRLGVDDKVRLGRFYWYPLEENFLTTSSYGEVRRDHVVFGSRRVYSALKSGYPYIHIFAIEEQKLYDLYRLQAEKLAAEVYILGNTGGLISSTDEAAVAACAVPAEIGQIVAAMQAEDETVRYKGELYNASCIRSELSGWTTLILVRCSTVTAATRTLYLKILAISVLCVALCFALLLLLYRQFMQPITQLEAAMHRADTGDLKAYVKPQGQAEMVRMMETYNYMLDGIRNGIEERMRLERMRQDLEMQVLMSQINPHFLYNTLESIVWKAGAAGQPEIGKLASSLGKLYRLSISGGLFVSLSQELEHVQMYMNIQQSRYANKVSYTVELNGLDPAQVQTLKLVLQPVVENCLLYGMDGLDRILQIRIDARKESGRLLLTVTDNGVGMDEPALERLRTQILQGRKEDNGQKNRRSTGIGLHNIDARLKLYAGAEYGLAVQSTPGVGTRVTLTLPYRLAGEPQPPA